MRARRIVALAGAGLLAACSPSGGEKAGANDSSANTAAASAPAGEKAPEQGPEERSQAQQPPERPLPDYAAFEMSDAQREERLSAAYSRCMDEAGATTDYRECSSAEFRRIERDMDGALAQAEQGLSDSGRQRLRGEQRRWRQGLPGLCQRELEEEGAEGGSMDLLTLDSCSLRELVRRTLWLESLS